MADKKTCFGNPCGCLSDFFFTFETVKKVRLHDHKVALFFRAAQMAVILYILLFVLCESSSPPRIV